MNRAAYYFGVLVIILFLLHPQLSSADTWLETGNINTPRQRNTATLLSDGTVLIAGGLSSGSAVLKSSEYYKTDSGKWIFSTGEMNQARYDHTATMLNNGKIFIAGGYSGSDYLKTTEIYDPLTRTWTLTGDMQHARRYHTATLLKNGMVLVAGGEGASGHLNTAELYDPVDGTWAETDSLSQGRYHHTSTLLPNGHVLVAGGLYLQSTYPYDPAYRNDSETYDPVSETWSNGPILNTARAWHTATLLTTGVVLLIGGEGNSGLLKTCEIYNGSLFSMTSSFFNARKYHSATLLPNGNVLITGGEDDDAPISSCEIFQTASYSWTQGGAWLNHPRSGHNATLLHNGQVLIAGGYFLSGYHSKTELYIYGVEGLWGSTGNPLQMARSQHTATALPDGTILVAGGRDGTTNCLDTSEILNADGFWQLTDAGMSFSRYNHTATLLPNGLVMIAGGECNDVYHDSVEFFHPGDESWSTGQTMSQARTFHTATLLFDGRVLVSGGYSGTEYLASSEIYDPATGLWTPANSLIKGRSEHTSTLLGNGNVLVVGGYDGTSYLTSVEIYNPSTNTWRNAGENLNIARRYHTATLLPGGKVLVAGGYGYSNYLKSAEIFDIATETWTEVEDMPAGHYHHTSTLLPNGMVLITGGYGGGYHASTELFIPSTRSWISAGVMNTPRWHHTATLRKNRTVLLTGGYNSFCCDALDTDAVYGSQIGGENRRPIIDDTTDPLILGNILNLSGQNFQGYLEGSGGNGSRNSPTNYPLVQLRNIENGNTTWLMPGSENMISDTNFTSLPLHSFPDGHAFVTVFRNGIPSESEIILVNSPPIVTSIKRADSNPTNSDSVNFIVTFSEVVDGVDIEDFQVTGTVTDGSISEPSGNHDTYIVTIGEYSGQGNLGLAVIDDDSIADSLGFPLDGDYTNGESYDIDMVAPFLASATVQPDGRSVEVIFTESMGTGVMTPSNYSISGDGKGTLANHPDNVIYNHDSIYMLVWNTGEMVDQEDVTITVSGMHDTVGNAVGVPNSYTDVGAGIGEPPMTTAEPLDESHLGAIDVTLTCSDSGGSGCRITYYSTDSSYPGIVYSEPITLSKDTALKFYSIDFAGNTENITTKNYSIDIPTTISCVLSEGVITYGESLLISGAIGTDPPDDPNQGVAITLIPENGPQVNLTTEANNVDGSFSKAVSCDKITGAGNWLVQTSWPGDFSHSGASSQLIPLTVNKAATELTLDIVISEAIKVDTRPLIGGRFTPEPYCESIDLSGTEIILRAKEPVTFNEHTLTAYTNQYGQFILDYDHAENGELFSFNVLGEWSITAEFMETNEFKHAKTESITMRVIPTAGYAILIQGRVASGEGMPSHHKTASFVYDKLRDRQILADDIQYLSWMYSDGWDGFPSKSEIQDAITVWARDKMDTGFHPEEGEDAAGQPGDLYIILIDHGWTDPQDEEEGVFYIYPDDPLASSELSAWINELQDNLAGTASADRNIVIILGFCRAGAFIEDLSDDAYDHRVIIASAAKDEASHRGPQDVDENGQPLRDGEYFVSEFFKSVSYGKSVKQCFEDATLLTEAFTSTGSGEVNAPYDDDSIQHPLLDDNGDDLGSNRLVNVENEDGQASEYLYIGASPPEGNDPGDVLVTKVIPAQFLGISDTTADLWAEVDNPNDLRLIWLEVKAPNYNPADPGAGFQIEMETFKKATTAVIGSRYLWQAVGGGSDPVDLFDIPGTYQVFFFAKDQDTGHVSPLVQAYVYKAIADNQAPGAFDLLWPNDMEETRTDLLLMWSESVDPDNDPVTYTVEIALDAGFTNVVHRAGHLVENDYLVTAGLNDLTTYYWRITAVDYYGGSTASTTVRSFYTNNTNILAGWIVGRVSNANTGAAISAATVKVNNQATSMFPSGDYLGMFTAGAYTVTGQAAGYQSTSYAGIVIKENGKTTRNILLEPDSDGDGVIDDLDGCDHDPSKTAPGQCGCGVADTDTDADGTADCIDGCDEDPYKTDPGVCGCGVADVDTDEDGDMDCIDLDDDDDGMPDVWEETYGLDPLANDADEDLDHDGLTNYEEYEGGSDPTDRNDPRPRFMPWLPILLE